MRASSVVRIATVSCLEVQTTSGKIARKHNLKAYLDRFVAVDVCVLRAMSQYVCARAPIIAVNWLQSPWAARTHAVLIDWVVSPAEAAAVSDDDPGAGPFLRFDLVLCAV
jgi:hypothetical protein